MIDQGRIFLYELEVKKGGIKYMIYHDILDTSLDKHTSSGIY